MLEHGEEYNTAAQQPARPGKDFLKRTKQMTTAGLDIIQGNDMTRIRAVCEHQRGLIYVVPAERSWVCDKASLPAHALAGFFRELGALKNAEVQGLMQEWGLYFRELPEEQEDAKAEDAKV